MRTHHRCPKCQGTKLYVCENRQPDREYTTGYLPFHITTVNDGGNSRTVVGTYETWICAACGYTEWFAIGVVPGTGVDQVLGRLSTLPGSGVRVVESPAMPPYR